MARCRPTSGPTYLFLRLIAVLIGWHTVLLWAADAPAPLAAATNRVALTSGQAHALSLLRQTRPAQPVPLFLLTDPNKDPDDLSVLIETKYLQQQGFLNLRCAVTTLGNRETRTTRAKFTRSVLDDLGLRNAAVGVGVDYDMEVKDAQGAVDKKATLGRERDHSVFVETPLWRPTAAIEADGLQLLKKQLSEVPDRSAVFVVNAGMADLAALLKDAPELVQQKTAKVVIMGGIEPQLDQQGFAKADKRAYNNSTHQPSADLTYRRVQELGLLLVIVNKEATYSAAAPRTFYDSAAATRHPIGIYLQTQQKQSLQHLWHGIQQGNLPPGLTSEWFFKTFTDVNLDTPEGQAALVDAKSHTADFEALWKQVSKFNLYDPLALLAGTPGASELLFQPEIPAGATAKVQVIGKQSIKDSALMKDLLAGIAIESLTSPPVANAPSATTAADLVLTGGKIVTLDPQQRIAESVAVSEGKILAVGSDVEIERLIGPDTKVIRLTGQTVVPGFIESHCHSVGVARGSLEQTYAELTSIAELQDWIRRAARDVPAGRWIEVPRNEITRFKERRFPTTAELDAACSTHPVLYNSVSDKYALNTQGYALLRVLKPGTTLEGGEVLRDEAGAPILIRGGTAAIRKHLPPRREFSRDEVRGALAKLLQRYNECGITSIFERAIDPGSLDFYRELQREGRLSVRVTGTFRFSAKTAEGVEKYVAGLGLKPREGDDWIKAGPLKITVDGGIHWGTTRLTEPYGQRRINFYRLTDPEYRGEQYYTVAEMTTIFGTANKLGWQMSCHVSGDEGTLRVLEAIERVAVADPSIKQRRFTLIHSYFPNPQIVAKCRELGVGVDTQGYLYYKDADTLSEIYGEPWAERFIGLGDWVRAGIPVAVNADHMIGFDPNHAMNSYNPLLMISIASTRQTLDGHVHGPHQKLSRADALRTVTQWPAWLSFDETKLGTIETGKLADLAILGRDLLNCPASELASIQVQRTIVGGKTVFERPAQR